MPTSSSLEWLSLVGIMWLQSISGTNSDFPAYSSHLKHILSLSQVQLNNLAFASDAGKLFGWVSGIAASYLPLWLVLVIGASLGLVGYGVQFLFLVNQLPPPSYWQIFMLTVLAGNSICWINTVCYVVTIRNFPLDRHIAVGISTSYVGLSAKIFTALVDTIFRSPPSSNAKAYLLLNSVVPLAVCVVTAPVVKVVEGSEGARGVVGGFLMMFLITIVTGIYAVIGTVGPMSDRFSPMIHTIVLGAFLASPLTIPVATAIRDALKEKLAIKREMRVHSFSVDGNDIGERVAIEVKDEQARVQGQRGGDHEQQLILEVITHEEIGVKKMVRKAEFWLFFFVYMFGATLGMVYLNNLGQIAESRGHSNPSILVSLSSSFGFFGRLLPSLTEHFLSKKNHTISRTATIVTLMVPMAGAFFMLLSSSNLSLYFSTAIIGVCTGAITSVAVSTTPELFGTKNFGVNHNIVVANIPLGSFLFGYLAAMLYQRQGLEGHGRCMGLDCYSKTFVIWGSVCSLGTLLSFILYLRTRKIRSRW